MPSPSIYDSDRLARAYAFERPPVHRRIVAAVRARLPAMGTGRARRALDIGCGAGLSTAALEPLAGVRVGLEPVRTMLRHHATVAPSAYFVVGVAERLPFAAETFDLVAAAGALNYAELDLALPEVARVLASRGVLLVYDFSGGRRLAADSSLDEWFRSFEARFPYPPGYAMDIRGADLAGAGLRLEGYEELEVALSMTFDGYVAYAMSETNVERALGQGEPEAGIKAWCRASLAPIFAAGPREVIFDAYAARVRKR